MCQFYFVRKYIYLVFDYAHSFEMPISRGLRFPLHFEKVYLSLSRAPGISTSFLQFVLSRLSYSCSSSSPCCFIFESETSALLECTTIISSSDVKRSLFSCPGSTIESDSSISKVLTGSLCKMISLEKVF